MSNPNRRCEGCGGAMPRRLHRTRDKRGRLVCDSCKEQGFGQWNIAYAVRTGMDEQQTAELRRREAEAIAAIRRTAEHDDDGDEEAAPWICPQCGGTGMVVRMGMKYPCSICDGTGRIETSTASLHKRATSEEWLRGYSAGVEAAARDGRESAPTGYPMMTADFREGWADGQWDALNDGTADGSNPFGRSASLRKKAHDSGDGQQIYHCPFCGSGAVTGGADGTVECDYCKSFFTVQVQPEFKSMPQTVNGQPFNIPGMPGGGPDAGATQQADQQAADDAQDAPQQDQQAPSGNPVPPQLRQSARTALEYGPGAIVSGGDSYEGAVATATRAASFEGRPMVVLRVGDGSHRVYAQDAWVRPSQQPLLPWSPPPPGEQVAVVHPDGSIVRQSTLDLSRVALMTPDGVVLDGEAYAKHLALRFADPEARPEILAQVRAANLTKD